MEWKAVAGGFVVRFAKGDDIVAGLLDLARTKRIESAWVNALGAAEDVELGYYDLPNRTYVRQVFHGDWEITALVGNLAWAGADPILHAHVTLGGKDFATRGGHLFAARAGATCEVMVLDLGVPLVRARDEAIGLSLLSLKDS
ncbi:MAG: PPC domain-containing DNA-binding protein [Candidatus Eiseniibacteriota bacterium]